MGLSWIHASVRSQLRRGGQIRPGKCISVFSHIDGRKHQHYHTCVYDMAPSEIHASMYFIVRCQLRRGGQTKRGFRPHTIIPAAIPRLSVCAHGAPAPNLILLTSTDAVPVPPAWPNNVRRAPAALASEPPFGVHSATQFGRGHIRQSRHGEHDGDGGACRNQVLKSNRGGGGGGGGRRVGGQGSGRFDIIFIERAPSQHAARGGHHRFQSQLRRGK